MKKYLIITLSLIIHLNSYSQQNENISTKIDSKSIFQININSQQYTLVEGDELILDDKIDKTKISVKLLDFKKFDNGDISFDYPSNFSFESEESEGYKNWNFDGNDYVISVFEIEGETTVKDFIDSMIEQFGKENCSTKDIQIELGNKKLNGIKLKVELAGEKIVIDWLKIETFNENSKYISFQDSTDDNGIGTQESVETFKLINDSIKFK